MKEKKYRVFNDTDQVYASPDEMTWDQAVSFMLDFVTHYRDQGFYYSVRGRIPLSELRLVVLSSDENPF